LNGCCIALCYIAEFSTFNHLKPLISAEDQAQAVTDLIRRNIGPRESDFQVTVREEIAVTNKDTFEVYIVFLFTC